MKKLCIEILVWTLVILMVVAGLLYIQASRIPDNYAPEQLTKEETLQEAHNFARHIGEGFMNKVQLNEPFEWSASQKTINRYLAAMDEIAFSLPSGEERGHVDKEMARLGLAGPAVALEDGKVTLMIRSTTYDKVLSADITVELLDDKRLKLSLSGTRIGKLPVPSSFLADKLISLSDKFTGQRAGKESKVMAKLLAAINGEPIDPPDTWRVKDWKVSIDSITIADGEFKMMVRPVSR